MSKRKRIRLYNSETQLRRELFSEIVDNVILTSQPRADSSLKLYPPSSVDLEGTERLATTNGRKTTYWRTYLAVSTSPETGILRRLNRIDKLADLPPNERPSRVVLALAIEIPISCLEKIEELGKSLGEKHILFEVWGAKDVRQHIGAAFKIVCPAFEYSHLIQLLEYLKNSKKLRASNGDSSNNTQERHLGTLFISYSRSDQEFTDKLVKTLTPYMEHVWYDKHEILVGENIFSKIGQGLDKADYVIVVLSKESVESTWVQSELASAFMRQQDTGNVRIFPILKEECSIPSLLSPLQYADFTKSFEVVLNSIMYTIRSLGSKYG